MKSPYVRYAAGILAGNLKGASKAEQLFASFVQAVVAKREKAERGVGMRGYKYSPDIVEFSHIIQMHSAASYKFMKDLLPVPVPRTLAYVPVKTRIQVPY